MQSDREIFFAALDVEDAGARKSFVAEACAGRDETRVRVEALLANHFAEDGFMAEAAAPKVESESPGTVIGRYKLLEKIGEGGVGDVYVAEQREPVKRKVALKVIKLGMDTRQVVARFEMERQALAMMDHPNIAKALDAGSTESGRPYFIMELVRGVRITDFCDENCFTTKERLELFVQVCNAVQHAHQKGIIHRDLKPSNILVTMHDGVAAPKVIDFGIAKATAEQLTDKTVYTQFQQFIGTPAYMSPEQAEMSGLDIDTRTDVYSLGVLLYELLTGLTPFDAKKLAEAGIDELRKTIRETDAMRPSTRVGTLQGAALTMAANRRRVEAVRFAPLLKGDLDWIVMKCLEKDRTRRYATVQDLSSDIQRHLHNEPIAARPPTATYRMQKAWRRNRLAISSAVALAAMLIVAVAVSSRQALIATQAKSAALKSQKTEEEARLTADAEKKTAQRNLYAANMNLIPQAWEHHDLGRVRQLLEETRAYGDRGFEWAYWEKRLATSLTVMRGHVLDVKHAMFSHAETRVATGGAEGMVIIWNAETGQEELAWKGHTAPVMTVAWSPDDRWLATASHDHTVRIWETATGNELLALSAGKYRLGCAVFSPDGKEVAAGGSDGVVHVWQLPSGVERLSIPAHAESIVAIAYSVDGKRIATASVDHLAQVFDSQTGRSISKLEGHRDWVRSVSFSNDGKRVLTGSDDSSIRIWNADTGEPLKMLQGHGAYVTAARFSPDETQVASTGNDWTLRFWDVREGKETATYKAQSVLNSVEYSRDGRRVVTGSDEYTAVIWNLDAQQTVVSLGNENNEVYAIGISGDGKRAVTADEDHRVRVWELPTGKELLRLSTIDTATLALSFSKDDRRILSGSTDRSARIWDAFSGRELARFNYAGPIVAAAFSADENLIVVGGRDAVVRVTEVASGKEILKMEGPSAEISSVSFSLDGKKIASGARDGKVMIWDAKTGKALAVLDAAKDAGWWVGFSPDGTRVASGGLDRAVRVWDATTGRQLFNLEGHSAWLTMVGFTESGNRIMTGSFDKTGRLWDAENGHEVLRLEGGFGRARFVEGGNVLMAASGHEIRVIPGITKEELAERDRWDAAASARIAKRHAELDFAYKKAVDERAKDPGVVRDWLIVAPIAIPNGMATTNALFREFLPNEGALKPKAGERVSVDGNEFEWKPHHMTGEGIDFNRFARQNFSLGVAYAVCYVVSETEQNDVRILVGSDDHARVFVNGEPVYAFGGKRYFLPDEDIIDKVRLKAGTNTIVFKVLNYTSEWKGGLRLVGQGGGNLKGIRIVGAAN